MKFRYLMIALSACIAGGGAYASPILPDTGYDLGNHPDGSVRPPAYGLRLDGLLNGESSYVYTFDFEAEGAGMHMFWDDEADELRIYGTVFGGRDTGTAYSDPRYWNVDFTYSGIATCFGDALCADDGEGTIYSAGFGGFDLVAYSGSHSYAFRLDTGHRGFAGISGWGWLNHCYADGEVDGGEAMGASCDSHVYSSDWLFTATQKVPEPGTLALLGLGLFGVGVARRQRRS